ncbi:TerD family protein [Streptomyces sp. JNUCC 64]
MTAELVRGQNHPLPGSRLEVRLSAGPGPVVVGAVLCDDEGGALGPGSVVHPGAPALPGLELAPGTAAGHRLTVDPGALPGAAVRVRILLALTADGEGPGRLGALPAPSAAVVAPDGTGIVRYPLTGLDTERAVVVLELYRRRGEWKVRAVGQGHAGGLAELFADHGLPRAAELAATVEAAVPRPPTASRPASVALPPTAPRPESVPRPPTAPRSEPLSQPPVSPRSEPLAGLGSDSRPDPVPEPGAVPRPSGAARPGSGSRPEPVLGSASASGAAADGGPTATGGGASGATRSTGGPIDYTHRGRTPTAPEPSPGRPERGPVAGDATGWSLEERLYNQVWGMFEDLARSVSAYRGAVDFAEARRERELDEALADPRARAGDESVAAREAARARYTALADRARTVLERDLAQLTAESAVVEPALPAAFARWDNAVWHAHRPPADEPLAVRLGDLRLPESGGLRVPMLVRLPLERGLWVDSGAAGSAPGDADDLRALALETAVTHAVRMAAVHPPGGLSLRVVDAAGTGTNALAPLLDSGALAEPPARGAAGVARTLGSLTRRVELVRTAVRHGAVDALPPDLDVARQLLIVNDFPHGFDDRAVTRLRYLADEGPGVGVHLLMVADRGDAAGFGPLLDPLWRSLLRLTPVPDDHLADPWVGHAWTYEPPLPPSGGGVLHRVLARTVAARRAARGG